MDFQNIVDNMCAMTCVVSVEKIDNGYGEIRIVTGNRAYIDSIENPAPGVEMLTREFIPNMLYTQYMTRDLNFEDFCFRAAVKKKCLHSYVHPDRMDVWFNMTFMPVGKDEGNISYCLYIMEINFEASSEHLSNISPDLASSVLDMCIKLRGTNDFRVTMGHIIEDIQKMCDAEHCCILLMNEIERQCDVLCEAFSEGSKLLPMETYVDDEFYNIAESWTDTIAGSNCLIVKDERDMGVVKERNPAWYESLRHAKVYNIVLFPLKSGNQLLGYIWALNYDQERAVRIKETLEVTTFILGSELGNHLLLDRLRFMSSKDMLTGVMNRNEMNNYVDRLAEGKCDQSVGVIFADLNGLKTVNDLEGHSAGDRLLKKAADVFRTVFADHDIYRAGGDEFAIIVTDVRESDLEEKMGKIRQACKRYKGLSLALGCAVEDNTKKVLAALKLADKRMYDDKKKYYEEVEKSV